MLKFKVEEVKKYKEVESDIVDNVKEFIKQNYIPHSEYGILEELEFEIDGIKFETGELDGDNIVDEGKYSYGADNYQLVSSKEEYNLILTQPFTRSGSYFSDYYYTYEEPEVSIIEIVKVPEIIIPAHEDVVGRYI